MLDDTSDEDGERGTASSEKTGKNDLPCLCTLDLRAWTSRWSDPIRIGQLIDSALVQARWTVGVVNEFPITDTWNRCRSGLTPCLNGTCPDHKELECRSGLGAAQ